jgi:hypothetical protein
MRDRSYIEDAIVFKSSKIAFGPDPDSLPGQVFVRGNGGYF